MRADMPLDLSRRALVLAATGGASMFVWPVAIAQGGAAEEPQVLQPELPSGPRFELHFDVNAEGENRVVFGSLRSTAPIAAITLIDPSRRRLWRRTPGELGLTPRERAARPELGDAIVLPEIRGAANGRWTLLIERTAPYGAPGRLLFAYRVLPRYDLLLLTPTPQVDAGQTVLVTVRATDYGEPIGGLKQIELVLLDASGQTVGHAAALENARSREGIALSNEPGSYIATLSLPKPGAYQLRASHLFGQAPRTFLRTALLNLSADQPGTALRLVSVRPDGAPGRCAPNLVFEFEAEVKQPGMYVCNLLLRAEDPAAPRASGSADLSGGRGTIRVVVSSTKWAAAGQPTRLARVTLLQVGSPGFKLLADFNDLDLASYAIDPNALCK